VELVIIRATTTARSLRACSGVRRQSPGTVFDARQRVVEFIEKAFGTQPAKP